MSSAFEGPQTVSRTLGTWSGAKGLSWVGRELWGARCGSHSAEATLCRIFPLLVISWCHKDALHPQLGSWRLALVLLQGSSGCEQS